MIDGITCSESSNVYKNKEFRKTVPGFSSHVVSGGFQCIAIQQWSGACFFVGGYCQLVFTSQPPPNLIVEVAVDG